MQFLKKLIYGNRYARVGNEAGERIETIRFRVPALHVGVLNYAPGQLETNHPKLQGKEVNLYYPPESVSDKKFLRSLEDSIITLKGHDKNTNERNKDLKGWPRSVRYDEGEQAAIVDGTVKGKEEADYIRNNHEKPQWGASALIDVLGLKVEDGVTPEGQPYNAIATKLRATHVTLADNVRDPDNKVEIVNAVCINTKASMEIGTSENTEEKMEIGTKEELVSLVKNTMKEVLAKNAEGEELADMKTALAKMQEAITTLQKAVGSETTERTAAGEVANEETEEEKAKKKKDEEDKKDGATLENAKPSQALVAAVSTACNIDFIGKTPSYATIANLLGVKEVDPIARITAVNAQFAKLTAASAQNAKPNGSGLVSAFGSIIDEEA
jgi:hypothetical protein